MSSSYPWITGTVGDATPGTVNRAIGVAPMTTQSDGNTCDDYAVFCHRTFIRSTGCQGAATIGADRSSWPTPATPHMRLTE